MQVCVGVHECVSLGICAGVRVCMGGCGGDIAFNY